MKIQSGKLTCSLDREAKKITLEPNPSDHTAVRFGVKIEGRVGRTVLTLLDAPWQIEEIKGRRFPGLPYELEEGLRINIPTSEPGVSFHLILGVSTDQPLLFLQAEINNPTNQPIHLHRLTILDIKPGEIKFQGAPPGHPAFFSNGWQSWSTSGAYQEGDRQRRSILGPFQNPMVVNCGTPKTRGRDHFTGDMFGVLGDLSKRVGFLAGFLSQKKNFGSLETRLEPAPSLSLWANGDGAQLPAGEQFQTDWASLGFIDIDAPNPLEPYLSAAAETHHVHTESPAPVGWCSWYHFYTEIDEEVIKSNLKTVADLQPEVPLPLFQIDDGFETKPGDWFSFTSGFPNGLAPLARNTRKAGLTPGVWLAPFIVHPGAKLVKEHPDWLLRNKHGLPVNAGFVWNRFTYALDLTNPDALAYTCQVIRTAVEKWGFTYLKLDFLYAAALDGVYQDPTKTRAEVLRMGLEALRLAAGPEVTLLGCGCPLGSGLGVFEAMRISADVSGHWKPHFPPFTPLLHREPHMPAARNALQNILSRALLHRHWWINDPDCLLIRPDTELTLAEVQTLATAIGLTGGSLLLSDDLPALPKTRLRIAQILLPLIDQRAVVIDWLDRATPSLLRVDLSGPAGNWQLLAEFNWADAAAEMAFSPQAFHLPEEGIWWVREFWTGQIGQMSTNSPIHLHNVPAHGVRVLAARPYTPEQPAYLGGELHLSQGLEIKAWHPQPNGLSFSLEFGHQGSGRIFLYLPKRPLGAWVGDETQMPEDQGQGVHSLFLKEAEGKEIHIKY
jgi:alpha-galactosidase